MSLGNSPAGKSGESAVSGADSPQQYIRRMHLHITPALYSRGRLPIKKARRPLASAIEVHSCTF